MRNSKRIESLEQSVNDLLNTISYCVPVGPVPSVVYVDELMQLIQPPGHAGGFVAHAPTLVITSALPPGTTSIRPVIDIATATLGDTAVIFHFGSGTGVPPSRPGATARPVSGL